MPTDAATSDQPSTSTHVAHLIEINGVNLHVQVEGSGDPIVLLHGFPFDSRIWDRVAPHLSTEFQVIRIDLRGAGRSETPRDGYTTPRLAADVLAALDALNVQRFTLVGHDWGGWIGYELALSCPERISKLVTIGTVHPWRLKRESLPNAWRFWHTFAFEHLLLGRLILARAPRFTRWLIRHWAADPSKLDAALVADFARNLQDPARARAAEVLHRKFVTRDIRLLATGHYRKQRLTVPTLALHGDRDPVAPPSGRALATATAPASAAAPATAAATAKTTATAMATATATAAAATAEATTTAAAAATAKSPSTPATPNSAPTSTSTHATPTPALVGTSATPALAGIAATATTSRPIPQADHLTFRILANCGHLAPLEQPAIVADAIADAARACIPAS